ncbi:glycosyltransferase family 2 protein [Flavihumibacter profundi]|uniref:glycosyltransferase family 2 protein n=1 Tax=Flavihumibacter profundi TaxID=2716883 RepID=UPI001CC5CB26|nr:glycosyltransferase family A protein [Flavihumibacter profundi]MBZ5857994.1 glycosyltransferase family 2 protein [Flavihumibacter profundi]
MDLPLVSIIIPAYNAEQYIKECLDSVLKQSWPNIEIVVVNDGSTDGTSEIVYKVLQGKNFIYHEQPNSGCSGAKNTGLRLANGEYIQYLDADDLLHRDKIFHQVNRLKRSSMAIAVSKTFFFHSIDELNENPELVEIDPEFLYDTDDTFSFLLNLYGRNGRKGMIQPNAFLIPRQLIKKIGDWDMSITPSPDEDGEYFCRAMLAAHSIEYTPDAINYYRRPLSISNNLSQQRSPKHVLGALKSIDRKVSHMVNISNTSIVKNILSEQYADFIYQYYPQYKDICELAMNRIIDLETSERPMAGGEKFRRLVKVIGFKNALYMRSLFSNLFSA